MTGTELENFYETDDRRYKLVENTEFMQWDYDMKINHSFTPIINLGQQQRLIDEIVMFYEFKYPSEMFDAFKYESKFLENRNTIKIAKMLGLEQLKFRLPHDYVQFLECNYWNYVTLKRPKKNMWELSDISIRVNPNGEIDSINLENLKENHFIDDINGIDRIEDLYGRFESIDTDVDYSELKRCIQMHKYNVTLRNKILNLIPYALVYSKNTLPKEGYIRAKSFVRTFNREYNLKINLDELEENINRSYSDKNKVKKLY